MPVGTGDAMADWFITRANGLYAGWPDLPMQQSMRYAHRRLTWNEIDTGNLLDAFEITPPPGTAPQAHLQDFRMKAARAVRLNLRRRALLMHGWMPGTPIPVWAHLIRSPQKALIESQGIAVSDYCGPAGGERLANAIRYRTRWDAQARILDGQFYIVMRVDRPGAPSFTINDIPYRITVHGIQIPDTVLTGLAGSPLSKVLRILPGLDDVVITHAVEAETGVEFGLESDFHCIAPIPSGVPDDWLRVKYS